MELSSDIQVIGELIVGVPRFDQLRSFLTQNIPEDNFPRS